MEITIWRRHSKDCPDRDDRYAPRCGCPLAFQFNWIQASTTFDGKKLKRGQNKWSANTRSMSEAQKNARKLENDLEDLLQGKQVRHGITIETAIREWWQFREKSGLGNTKAKLMGQKLIDWCQENDVLLITALTTDRAMKFRMSLPFRTGDSTSLKVHWSVIGGFFSWAVGMGYIDKTPIPNARQFPQFKIVVKKKEVKPPTYPNAKPRPVKAEIAADGLHMSWLSMPCMTEATDSPNRMMVNKPNRSRRCSASGGYLCVW